MILLDTHVFVWWATGNRTLTTSARRLLENASTVYVSAVAFWEIAIKASRGRSGWDATTAPFLHSRMAELGCKELPVEASDTFAVGGLAHPGPRGHKDPFDRLMVVQARTRGFDLITSDALLAEYGSNVVMV